MPVKLWNTDISKIYLGNTPVMGAYLGESKVYPNNPFPDGAVCLYHGKTENGVWKDRSGNNLDITPKYGTFQNIDGWPGSAGGWHAAEISHNIIPQNGVSGLTWTIGLEFVGSDSEDTVFASFAWNRAVCAIRNEQWRQKVFFYDNWGTPWVYSLNTSAHELPKKRVISMTVHNFSIQVYSNGEFFDGRDWGMMQQGADRFLINTRSVRSKCHIYHTSLYPRVLTPEEIQQLHNAIIF